MTTSQSSFFLAIYAFLANLLPLVQVMQTVKAVKQSFIHFHLRRGPNARYEKPCHRPYEQSIRARADSALQRGKYGSNVHSVVKRNQSEIC